MTSKEEKLVQIVSKIPLNCWMSCIPEKYCSLPLNYLFIPGSHDSASYALDLKSGIAPDRPDFRRSKWIKMLPCFILPIIRRWTQTQRVNIETQLQNGIRYFDIRVGSKQSDPNHLYFVHSLYGPKIEDICRTMNKFLNENSKEVIILDFQHFYEVTDKQHYQLITKLLEIFGSKVCPWTNEPVTLNSLWSNSRQVIIVYRIAKLENKILWPSDTLPNPWANTMNLTYLRQFLFNEISNRNEKRLFVAQCILTPNQNCVIRNFFSSLYRVLVIDCNLMISQFILNYSIGSKSPNIVMIDFLDWNQFDIPKNVIAHNFI